MWRTLAAFWAMVLLVCAGGAGLLQYLGPLKAAGASTGGDSKVVAAAPATSHQAEPAPKPHVAHAEAPAHVAQIAAPPPTLPPPTPPPPASPPPPPRGSEATLLESSALYVNGQLPRIATDGRTPRQAYAAAFDTSDTRPRIAILLAGIGMDEAASMAALDLPAQVSFAVTPYATRLEKFVPAARAAGHELLLSMPMEPQGYPLNDPGNRALLTGASPLVNAQLTEWALTRFTGYVGVTGALGQMRGERFAAALGQMKQLQTTLGERGLLYVDPRPNAAWTKPGEGRLPTRGIDVVLDETQGGGAEIDKALARLERIARDRGAAMGLAGRPSPLAVDRIAVWAAGLDARGVALAPVSVVVQMPQASTPPIPLPITMSQRTVPLP